MVLFSWNGKIKKDESGLSWGISKPWEINNNWFSESSLLIKTEGCAL